MLEYFLVMLCIFVFNDKRNYLIKIHAVEEVLLCWLSFLKLHYVKCFMIISFRTIYNRSEWFICISEFCRYISFIIYNYINII